MMTYDLNEKKNELENKLDNNDDTIIQENEQEARQRVTFERRTTRSMTRLEPSSQSRREKNMRITRSKI